MLANMSPSVFGSGGQPRLFSLDDINIPQGQDSALSTKLAAEAISFDFASEPAANVSKPANNNNVVFQFRSQEDSDMLAERQQKAWRYMRPTKEPILKLSDGRGPSPAVEYNTMVDDLEYVRCNNGSAKPILNSTSIDFAFDHGAVLLPSTYSKNSNFQIGGTRKIAQPVSRLLGGRNISPAAEHKSVLDDDEYDPMQDVEDIVARDGSSSVEEIGNDLAQPQHTKSDAGSLVGLFEDTLRLQGRPRNDCVFLMAPEQTKVLVGYAIDDEFSINTHLARHYSAYFQDIITAQNPQLPHPTVSLLHLDLDRAAFRTFTRWLTQPRPLNRVQLATVFDSGPEDYEGHLVHLYRLARHLRIPMLANDSMSAFIDFCSRTGPPLVSTIVESFTKLPETSALCKFLIHLETRGSEPRGWTSEELERLPGTFRALLLRAAKMRLEKGGIPAAYLRPIRPCAYHVHHAGEGGNGEGDTATYVSEEQYLKCESELGWGWKFSTHPPVPEGWQITEARKQVVERDVTGRMSFASHMGLVPEGVRFGIGIEGKQGLAQEFQSPEATVSHRGQGIASSKPFAMTISSVTKSTHTNTKEVHEATQEELATFLLGPSRNIASASQNYSCAAGESRSDLSSSRSSTSIKRGSGTTQKTAPSPPQGNDSDSSGGVPIPPPPRQISLLPRRKKPASQFMLSSKMYTGTNAPSRTALPPAEGWLEARSKEKGKGKTRNGECRGEKKVDKQNAMQDQVTAGGAAEEREEEEEL